MAISHRKIEWERRTQTNANTGAGKGIEEMWYEEVHRVAADWAGGGTSAPEAFVLVGYHGPYVANDHGTPPLLIDAEGVVLASGAVYAWCHGGCCEQRPRPWVSVDAAADFHGSYIVTGNGTVRAPETVEAGR